MMGPVSMVTSRIQLACLAATVLLGDALASGRPAQAAPAQAAPAQAAPGTRSGAAPAPLPSEPRRPAPTTRPSESRRKTAHWQATRPSESRRPAPATLPSDSRRKAAHGQATRASGYGETPRPGDSRFPAEPPRPTGALLARLPAGIVLLAEQVRFTCDARGLSCEIRHRFRLRNTQGARDVLIGLISPTVPRLRIDGHPASLEDWPATRPHPTRQIRSSNQGLHPDTGRPLRLPGPPKRRRLRRDAVRVRFASSATRTLTLITQSVAGFDRGSRPRTQPEVSFLRNRRRDPFTYHHEIRLCDPEARALPGGEAGRVDLVITAPLTLDLVAGVPLRCTRTKRLHRCSARVDPHREWIRVTLTERRKLPLGGFVTVGADFTRHATHAWIRAGVALLLRSRKDVLALAGETDARQRLSFSLAYQLFLPYAPSTHEMGGHAELGGVLDVLPRVRPAIRLGVAFHMSILRLTLLADLYPDALAHRPGPGWRILLGAGLGI